MCLAQFARKIRVVAFASELKSKLLQDKVRSHPQFEVFTNTEIVSLEGIGSMRSWRAIARPANLAGDRAGPSSSLASTPIRPSSADRSTSIRGLIVADQFETSLPGVFAAGDCRPAQRSRSVQRSVKASPRCSRRGSTFALTTTCPSPRSTTDLNTTQWRPDYAGAGTAPICWSNPSMSRSPVWLAILPFRIRSMCVSETVSRLPVAGTPMNSPV